MISCEDESICMYVWVSLLGMFEKKLDKHDAEKQGYAGTIHSSHK